MVIFGAGFATGFGFGGGGTSSTSSDFDPPHAATARRVITATRRVLEDVECGEVMGAT